jgi:hypothetical protein
MASTAPFAAVQAPIDEAVPASPSAAPDSREQFIPLRKAELIEAIVRSADLTSERESAFRRLCGGLQALLHREYQGALDELKDSYAPFDPDADTRPIAPISDADRVDRQNKLFERFGWLLGRGNFIRVDQKGIDEALRGNSAWGLKLTVDFEIFERLEIYYRGDAVGTRFRRRLVKGFKIEAVDVPVYERLVLIFRFRPGRRFSKFLDTDDVHIKLFKEIPKLDLDMLLPGTEVKMSLVDRAKILLPTLSGLSVAGAKIVLAWGTGLAMWGLVGGTLGYGARSVFGYLNTKQKYQLNLTQSLYYQNIDNNAGVIHRMLDEAEEQENREALLAYFFLWQEAPAEGWSTDELDKRIEAFLRTAAAREVDFEVGDALDKLERFQIVERRADGRWSAVAMGRALEAIATRWTGLLGF